MGILIALLGILLILLSCDVQMRLSYYLDPGNRFPNLSRLQFWGLRSIVAVVQTYVGFRILRETQAALLKLARLSRRQAVCPAVSVAVHGGYRIAKLKGLVRNLRGCVYRVRLLNPYPPPRGRSEVQDMLQQAHDEIQRQVNTWKKIEK
jgi:hypothetical protein